jgi:hypothetical protein
VPWRLTVRAQARVRKERFDSLETALDRLETEARALANDVSGQPIDAKIRRFEPAQIVAGRIELSGPQRLASDVSAGVDVRRDGSVEAYTGRIRKRVIEQRGREDAYAALRRELKGRASRR